MTVPADILDSALDLQHQAHPDDETVEGRELLQRVAETAGRSIRLHGFPALYFHANRSTESTPRFREQGLLPLHEVIDGIWNDLSASCPTRADPTSGSNSGAAPRSIDRAQSAKVCMLTV